MTRHEWHLISPFMQRDVTFEDGRKGVISARVKLRDARQFAATTKAA